MGSLIDFLPIITILAIGAGIWHLLSRFESTTFRKTEYFNIFLLIGSFSLILPLTWIGIQPNGILTLPIGQYSVELMDFVGWCMFYFLIGIIISIIAGYYVLRKLLTNLEHFQFDLDTFKDYRIILLSFLLLDYFILELILPLRGFDALYYYFPEAEVFYQAGRITEINYLSFLPVVKSPLNVLLYVYAYYITGDLAIQLIPFLFLLGLVLLIYDFAIEFFNNHSLALIAAIFTLVLPLTYWLMNYWAFYQDLYLCYFFSVTCYFSLKWYKSPSNLKFGLFMGIGLVTSLLTKITAWILPIILILWIPTRLRGKNIRVAIIFVLGIFLCIQVATRIFIGISLPIIISLAGASYLIFKEKLSEFPTRTIIQLIPISLGTVIGSFWLFDRIALSSSIWEEIYNSYFRLTQEIIWTYPQQPLDPLLQTLEHVHRINFISAAGFLLLGTCFVLPWLILKIFALRNFQPITAPLIWILVFFGIWSTYYLNGSIRYLTPIITPMILCISWGFYQLTQKINNKKKKDFFGILFAFLGCFNFYYLIPLKSLMITDETQEIIGLSYNQAALNYYSLSPFPFLLVRITLTFVFSIVILAFIKKDMGIQLLNSLGNKIKIVWLNRALICGIIIIPLAVQSYLLLYTQGNFDQFHAVYEYEYRSEYQELVTVLQQQNQPLAGIMTVRTPGIQFFTKQPVIDIYYQYNLFNNNPFFNQSIDLTELLEILRNPLNYTIQKDFNFNLTLSIRFIVVPSTQNLYYNVYNTQIKVNSLLFQSLEINQSFNFLYKNSDFLLYEVKF
ncbi:MAG: hypothetical protein ACXADY_06215 [Candidatus Hodarchaeales archaeon]|jgi:hypothetical protein